MIENIPDESYWNEVPGTSSQPDIPSLKLISGRNLPFSAVPPDEPMKVSIRAKLHIDSVDLPSGVSFVP